MRMGWPLGVIILSGATSTLVGCSKNTTVNEPEFGVSVTRMSNNVLTIDRCLSNQLTVNAARIDDREEPRYVLWVEVAGSTPVQPDAIMVQIDGDEWDFEEQEAVDVRMACPERKQGASLPGSSPLSVAEVRGCVYTEIYWLTVTPEQLARLGAAHNVTMQLRGINGHMEKGFSPDNLTSIEEFVIQHVPEAKAFSG